MLWLLATIRCVVVIEACQVLRGGIVRTETACRVCMLFAICASMIKYFVLQMLLFPHGVSVAQFRPCTCGMRFIFAFLPFTA